MHWNQLPFQDHLVLDNSRLARMVDLCYYAGCSLEEVAGLMGRSLAALKRDWTYARAWLFDRMSAAPCGGAP